MTGETPDTRGSSADELEAAVVDFVGHLHDDLPAGPDSELGSEGPPLNMHTEAELRRLAALGKAIVDSRTASRT